MRLFAASRCIAPGDPLEPTLEAWRERIGGPEVAQFVAAESPGGVDLLLADLGAVILYVAWLRGITGWKAPDPGYLILNGIVAAAAVLSTSLAATSWTM